MSVIGESLVFLDTLGLYDVILPFLLVFTLVFGVLEKSRIFGTEKIGDYTVTKKNLNAMIAFCVGFFVVASVQLVTLINVFVAQSALVLMIIIMFMILIGAIHAQQDDKGLDLTKWSGPFAFIIIVALTLIFLNGVGWLGPLWLYVTNYWDSQLMGTLILFAIIIGVIFWITSDSKKKDK